MRRSPEDTFNELFEQVEGSNRKYEVRREMLCMDTVESDTLGHLRIGDSTAQLYNLITPSQKSKIRAFMRKLIAKQNKV